MAATEAIADAEVHHWAAEPGEWVGPLNGAELADISSDLRPMGVDSGGLKRRVFPSTLWESGRAASRSLPRYLARLGPLTGETSIVLHTSYLAPAIPAIRGTGAPVAVDLYDLVWRAHWNDSIGAGAAPSRIRRAYARALRPRETRRLSEASRIAVAGYDDATALRASGIPARWVPTPIQLERARVEPARPGQRLRIGFLGNFAHRPTRASAARLLATPLCRSPEVTTVLAGLGSERWIDDARRVEVLGPVARPEDFYSRIDCVVAPVAGGSGITCKVAEAVLAGRLTVTTAVGGGGFSPALRRHLMIRPLAAMDVDEIRAGLERHRAAVAAADFADALAWENALAPYAEALLTR